MGLDQKVKANHMRTHANPLDTGGDGEAWGRYLYLKSKTQKFLMDEKRKVNKNTKKLKRW